MVRRGDSVYGEGEIWVERGRKLGLRGVTTVLWCADTDAPRLDAREGGCGSVLDPARSMSACRGDCDCVKFVLYLSMCSFLSQSWS